MQFHLNGFHPGDPRMTDPQDRVVPPPIKRLLPSHCDVMIVGCGPAGLNLAAQLSQFSKIHTVITAIRVISTRTEAIYSLVTCMMDQAV